MHRAEKRSTRPRAGRRRRPAARTRTAARVRACGVGAARERRRGDASDEQGDSHRAAPNVLLPTPPIRSDQIRSSHVIGRVHFLIERELPFRLARAFSLRRSPGATSEDPERCAPYRRANVAPRPAADMTAYIYVCLLLLHTESAAASLVAVLECMPRGLGDARYSGSMEVSTIGKLSRGAAQDVRF